ncbi:MAG TPA: DUF3147 family protein [Vicinamibacterales bacterium]|nr:DUF3147 family protein [Vicinamibacterales bacterium]
MGDLLLRALAGGLIVSAFALLGDVLQPKSFAGLFGAAPSVALASLAITFRTHDAGYVANETAWMCAGAIAFAVYSWLVCRALKTGRHAVVSTTVLLLIAWFVVALGGWWMVSRAHQV